MLDPLGDCLNAEMAQRIVALSIDPAVPARIEELANRCNEALGTGAERAESESSVTAAEILSRINLKARRDREEMSFISHETLVTIALKRRGQKASEGDHEHQL